MMYMGSKRRLVKHILPIMLRYRRPGQTWVEPFVGGGNMIENVTGPRIGADANPYVISALKSIRDCPDDLPKNNTEFTEQDYKALRSSDDYRHKGFAGFAYSYAAKWLGGWARNSTGSDYVSVAYRSAQRQSPLLAGIELQCCEYKDLRMPPNSIVYCDPPYVNTTGYRSTIDHDHFWTWCEGLSAMGWTVFVSERRCPDGIADCVWSGTIDQSVSTVRGRSMEEKLFLVRIPG